MKQLRRIAAIALWILAVCWGWVLSLHAGLRLFVYDQQKYHWQPLSEWMPEWVASAIFVGLFGVGTIVITVGALILGMRGRLPGTSKTQRETRGFPI